MSDQEEAALEAAQIVVPTEGAEPKAPEAVESTTGEPNEDPQEPKDPEAKEPEPKEPDEPAKKSRGERRREKMAESEAEKQRLEQELSQAQERIQRLEEEAMPLPQEADFATYEAYQAALAAHASVQVLDGRQKGEAQRQIEQAQAQIQDATQASQRELAENWNDQVADASKRYADFEQVALDPSLPMTGETAEMLAASDNGADVAYYLGSNRKEAREIAALTPLEQARRIGAIEARLSLPKANTISNAPDPINPLKKGGAAPAGDPANMSPGQFRKWREGGGTF